MVQTVEDLRLKEMRRLRLPVYCHKQSTAGGNVYTGLIDLAVEKATQLDARYICFDDKDIKDLCHDHVSQHHPSIMCVNHPIDVADNSTICMVKNIGKNFDLNTYMNEQKHRSLVYFFYTTHPQLVKNFAPDADILTLDEGTRKAYEKEIKMKVDHIYRLFYQPVAWAMVLLMTLAGSYWRGKLRLKAVVVDSRKPQTSK